jgi:hypothetical protein
MRSRRTSLESRSLSDAGPGRAAAAALALVATLALGCPVKKREAAVTTPREQGPPEVETTSPETVPAPLPTEAELALQAAEDAEARDDLEAAMELYDWAYMAQRDRMLEGEIHYRIARLRVDPQTPGRDLEVARQGFERLLSVAPDHPHARESRIMIALIEEALAARSEAGSLRAEVETLKASQAALKEEIDKKEKELQRVQDVLLKKKP